MHLFIISRVGMVDDIGNAVTIGRFVISHGQGVVDGP